MKVGRRPPAVPVVDEQRKQRVAEIKEVCDLAANLTLAMGGSPATAYIVAAELAYGLEDPAFRPRRWVRL